MYERKKFLSYNSLFCIMLFTLVTSRCLDGSLGWARSNDLRFNRPPHYQLCYERISCIVRGYSYHQLLLMHYRGGRFSSLDNSEKLTRYYGGPSENRTRVYAVTEHRHYH